MDGMQKTTQWFERAKVSCQGALIGAVFSDAAGMIMNAPMNSRIVYSFCAAVGCAILADRYIAKPAIDKNKIVWGRQPE